jgi:heme/copper-type cytochrome/quinol oxidase subunit 2
LVDASTGSSVHGEGSTTVSAGLVGDVGVVRGAAASLGQGGEARIVQVVGHQWYWEVGGRESRMVRSSLLTVGAVRLSLVDQPLFVCAGSTVCLGVTSADVIHCYSVPGLGLKVDAIPGRVSWLSLHTSPDSFG